MVSLGGGGFWGGGGRDFHDEELRPTLGAERLDALHAETAGRASHILTEYAIAAATGGVAGWAAKSPNAAVQLFFGATETEAMLEAVVTAGVEGSAGPEQPADPRESQASSAGFGGGVRVRFLKALGRFLDTGSVPGTSALARQGLAAELRVAELLSGGRVIIPDAATLRAGVPHAAVFDPSTGKLFLGPGNGDIHADVVMEHGLTNFDELVGGSVTFSASGKATFTHGSGTFRDPGPGIDDFIRGVGVSVRR